jgi:surface carbohydrate biosynthesis protein
LIKIELLIKTIKFFFNKKYYFLLPVKNQYVIINHIGKNLLERCIGENFYSIDITKSINIYIFFKTFFKCVIKKNFDPYIECYIDSISPIAVFCFTTNYIQFYRIKKNKNIKYIAIQNGVNLGNGQFQIYKKILQKKYYCDYVFCYGDFDKKLMGKVINAKFYKIGSFVGNMIKKNKNKVEKNISYISTYRNLKNDKYDKNSTIGREIDFESFYSTEKIILNFLNNFCKKNKLKFRILGATQQSGHLKEFLFYKKIITGKGWLYVPKINFMSNYIETDYSTIVAFIDSSLGYESLARYNKTAAFCVRGQHLKIKGFQFSSGNLPKVGPFWSSNLDLKRCEKILNYLLNINQDQWLKIWDKYSDKICKFDPGNKIFFKTLMKNKLIKKRKYYYFN